MIHSHPGATAQQTRNINFFAVLVYLPSRAKQVLTCTFAAPELMVNDTVLFRYYYRWEFFFLCFLLSSLWAVNQLDTPT